jgi:hypothetical protein
MRPLRLAALAVAPVLLAPPAAEAHGIIQRADLPIPEWLFGWAAAVVLIVSFVALAALWPQPKLEGGRDYRPLPGRLGGLLAGAPFQTACGAIGALLLAVVVWSGLAGEQVAATNLAPTFVFVVFWVGLVPVSILLGDVFRAFNPWRALGRAAGWLAARVRGREREPHPYPERLGRWPAAVGILMFAWLELAATDGDKPRNAAIAALVYTGATLAAMARFGVEQWLDRGEAFSVYFNLFARISPFETREREVCLRRPLTGLTALPPARGTVPLLAVMIGTVTYDGFSAGTIWRDAQPEIASFFESLSVSPGTAIELTATVGLLAGVAAVLAFYTLGVAGARSVGGSLSAGRLRRAFVHSLVPIAVAYVMAHYLSLLVFQGQAARYLASDPLGRGWDIFGTASAAIDYGALSQNQTWYLQVGFVVAGHVAALTLAHDRALVLYDRALLAVRSQYWMLAVMVGFTTLALWLLASANA